jgi:hypothetical protein
VKLTPVLCFSLCVSSLWAQAPDPAGTGKKALDLFLGGKYAELNQMIAPATKDSYTEEKLSKLAATTKAWGDVKKVGQPTVGDMGPVSMVTIPVEYAERSINYMFPVNASGQITQIFMRPAAVAWQHADYVKSNAFQTREVTIGSDEWKLPGTLTIPLDKKPAAAVILVQDRGPADRDASVFALKSFRDLAEGLSSRGVAVLRFDNRDLKYPTKMGEGSFTIDDEIVHDAAAAIALLRSQPEIDGKRIYVLGLGVGGYIAPRIAADDGHLAGLIIVGAPQKSLEDWYVETVESMGATGTQGMQLDARTKQAAQKVKHLDPGDTDAPTLFGLPSTYWLDIRGYDPAAEAKKLQIPTMVIQGDRDFQVIPKEFEGWKAALGSRRDAVLKEYPNLNHYLIAGEGKGSEAEYRKPGHVAPVVLDDIVAFIKP